MKVGNMVLNVYREESAATDKLTAALGQAWPEFLVVPLDREGKRNGEKFRYASINAILRSVMPALVKYKLWPYAPFCQGDQSYVTVVIKHTPSDQWVSSTCQIPRAVDMQGDKAWKTTLVKGMLERLLNVVMEEGEDHESVAVPFVDGVVEQPAGQTAAQAERSRANAESAKAKVRSAKSRAEADEHIARAEGYLDRGLMVDCLDELREMRDDMFPEGGAA